MPAAKNCCQNAGQSTQFSARFGRATGRFIERAEANLPSRGHSATHRKDAMHKLFLLIAIVSEVAATTALKSSESFTRPWPSLIVVVGYGCAFYCLSLCLKTISMGTAYALWSGVGIVMIAIIGATLYQQTLDLAALVGIALIVAGVMVLNLFSKTVVH